MTWIKCSERLPSPSLEKEYLTYDGCAVSCAYYFGEGRWNVRWDDITHWADLPEPPND